MGDRIIRKADFRIGDWDFSKLGINRMVIPTSRITQLAIGNNTSGGVLKKFNLAHSELGLLYVKSGSSKGMFFGTREPLTEHLCSAIGLSLGFDVVPYSLWVIDKACFNFIEAGESSEWSAYSEVKFPQNYQNFQRALNSEGLCLVSVSTDFVGDKAFVNCNAVHKDVPRNELYDKICKANGPDIKRDLDRMIVFDYLVHNTDRHLRNFGFLRDGEKVTLAPLYDHGLSLCADIDESEIDDYGMEVLSFAMGKPFGSLHKSLEYVSKSSLDGIRFEMSVDHLEEIVMGFEGLFSPTRLHLITQILKRRWSNVQGLFS